MIDQLRIRSLGVIEEAVIDFGCGLTVLTGETGAGKTMVLTGLGMVMGERAESAMVRRDAERADVDSSWTLMPDHSGDVVRLIEEHGGEVDAGSDGIQVVLARTVSASGRSRGFAGGRSVPAAVLAEVSSRLLALHGQADQIRIRDTRVQRALLDRFAGVASQVSEFSAALARLRAVERERQEREATRRDREREAVLMRHGIAEIEAVRPEPGEDEELKGQAARLSHATELLEQTGAAHAALTGGDAGDVSAMAALAAAARHLDRAAELDESVRALREALEQAAEQVSGVAAEVARYAAGVDADPALLAGVQERRQQLSDLKRRYGPELADVLDWWRRAEQLVADVDGDDEHLAELGREQERLVQEVLERALELTAARRNAAMVFAERISAELRELAMPDAVVRIDVDPTEDLAHFTATGADEVSMHLTPHAGSDPRPLGAGASGGELSRLMLAIEVVLAGVDAIPTFVFDEIDAGIGGRVAVEVGRRLARLARSAQVIVVTHLPQVAAFADTHIVVRKDTAGSVTASSVAPVAGEDRVNELVRMLSGLEGSASGAAHAAELLELASAERVVAKTGRTR